MSKTVIAVDGAPRPFAGRALQPGHPHATGWSSAPARCRSTPTPASWSRATSASRPTRVLQSLKAVLEGAGSSLNQVVKTTVFMTDLGEFAAMNEVYATYFSSDPPARSTVQVAALPAGARVEIEAIALA